jgi:hypothetical protein
LARNEAICDNLWLENTMNLHLGRAGTDIYWIEDDRCTRITRTSFGFARQFAEAPLSESGALHRTLETFFRSMSLFVVSTWSRAFSPTGFAIQHHSRYPLVN